MYRQQEIKDRTVKEALFFVFQNRPNYGAFILLDGIRKNLCYR